MSSRFDLDTSVAAWRRVLEHNPSLTADDVAELVQHLRDQVAALTAEGLGEEEAFRRAMGLMGDYATAEAEYRKVYWSKLKRRHLLADELERRLSMLANYVKTALRNLRRQKGYAFINVAGLALGLASCLVIFQYVAFEYSFDRFHAKADEIYRLDRAVSQNGALSNVNPFLAAQAGPTFAQEVPGIEQFVRIHPNYGDAVVSRVSAAGKSFKESGLYYVDPSFLELFTFPLVQGDPAGALREPRTLLLSASAARRYFGAADPLGEVLQVGGWVKGEYTVTGVFEDVPAASHLQFDFLLPVQDLLAADTYSGDPSGWHRSNFFTYVQVREGTDLAALERGMTAQYEAYNRERLRATNSSTEIRAEPLPGIHLNGEIVAPYTRVRDARTVHFFAVVALLTLVIALFNYVNLSTARALDRAKEVGVRKVVGAGRRQIVVQFLFESALVNGVALVVAAGLATGLLPLVRQVWDVPLTGVLWTDARFWGGFVLVFGAGVVLAGLYPAFVLSRFQPVRVLKGRVHGFTSRYALRKVLVVFQFAASIALLAGTLVVYAQLGYVQRRDLGVRLDQVLVVEAPRVFAPGADQASAVRAFVQEALGVPGVRDAASSNAVPGIGFNWYGMARRPTADPATAQDARAVGIGERFVEVYGLRFVAGEGFAEASFREEEGAEPVLLNETAVARLGFADPDAAVGQPVDLDGNTFTVRGVVADFVWGSAREQQVVLLLYPTPGGSRVSLQVGAADLPRTLAAVRQRYEALFPGNPFTYTFADQGFAEQYEDDRRFAVLFGVFAGLAILIACLGLFGLAAFTAERRTKEVGVRKVMGASVAGIVVLLSRDFLGLVVVAVVLATPVAYLAMERWLDGFAYRISLGPGVFVLAACLALAIGLLTVSYQAVKAALTDPVKSLRYE